MQNIKTSHGIAILGACFLLALFVITSTLKQFDSINLSISTTSQLAQVAPTTGLIAHYTFDGNTNDSAGSNSGTVSGGPTYTTGKIGQAIQFDGVDDLVNTGSNFIGANDVTISAWINPSGYGEGGSNGTIVTNGGLTFRLRSPCNCLDFRSIGNTMSGSAQSSISLTGWQHVLVTRSGTTVNVYVNGVQSGTPNQTNDTPTTGSTNVFIGNRSSGDLTFQGLIDDVRIYNRVLTLQEISDLYNDIGGSGVAQSSGDTQTPSTPSGLSATVVSTSGINLSWSASTDDTAVTGYRIFRDGTEITTVTSTTYSNTGLTAGTLYSYTVSAYDGAGNVSAQSSSALATTQALVVDTTAPSVPPGLSVTAVSSSQINLNWSASTDAVGVTGYRIYRNGSEITTTVNTSYLNTGLSPSTSYSYTVSAYDGAGNVSAQSSPVSATTQALAITPSGECAQANIRCVGSGQEYSTIQACANVAVAGDTCLVYPGTYDERVTPANSGASNSNRIKFLATSGARPIVKGFTTSNKNYITIEGFEITNRNMIPENDRRVSLSGGTGIRVINNYIHDTSYAQCILSRATFSVFSDNEISYCGEAMSILGTATGSKTIVAGVNDQIKFSVQGGPSQTITLPAGIYTGSGQYANIRTGLTPPMVGATLEFGASGRFEIRSSTVSPLSTITLESVANNAYSTFGWSVGLGTMQGLHAAITIAGSDNIFENNTVSHVGDYVTTGDGPERVVIRNNIFGPADPFSAQHIDGIQSNSPLVTGTRKVLFEGNISRDNHNSDNHLGLFQQAGDSNLILRYNISTESPGSVDFSRGTYYGSINTTLPGSFFYHNTFYNNANYLSPNGIQIGARTSLNNFARNNIWYNSSALNPYSPANSTQAIDKDYDLWSGGTGDPVEVHDVNLDPRFLSGSAGNFQLQSSSPAIDHGGPLATATNTGSNSTSLQVTNAGFFQDGWAGVTPDRIAVGSTGNFAQISSIDYTTNTITLSSPLTWSIGAPVYLHSKSDGTQVLYGSAPDIGAYEYNNGQPVVVVPPTPTPALDTTGVIASSVTTTGATIAWTTNQSSTSQVEYGLTTAYGNITSEVSTPVTSHSQNLSNLTPNTIYNYRVISKNGLETKISTNQTFTTLPLSDTTPPAITILGSTAPLSSGSTSVTLTITTNEASTCKWGRTSNVLYASVPNTFSADTNRLSHSGNIMSLVDGVNNVYIRCSDTAGNVNTTDTVAVITVASAVVSTTSA